MSNDTTKVDKCILSPPGGPAGPFWGIVKQSGRVVALQIIEREDAEILRIVGNLLAGDVETIRAVAEHLTSIFDESLDVSTMLGNDESYFVKTAVEAILGAAKEQSE